MSKFDDCIQKFLIPNIPEQDPLIKDERPLAEKVAKDMMNIFQNFVEVDPNDKNH